MKRTKIIILLLILVINNSCQQLPELPTSLSGMLLCVEDIDGKGGIYDYNFGDIVVYNLKGEKYCITKDSFFDISPTYSSNLNKVYFESQRVNVAYSAGVSNSSDIFEFDPYTKSFTRITDSIILEMMENLTGMTEFSKPQISQDGKKILLSYLTLDSDFDLDSSTPPKTETKILLFDLINKNIENIDFILSSSFDAKIIDKERLLFSKYIEDEFSTNKYIGIYNLKSKISEDLFIDSVYSFSFSDYLDDIIIIYKYIEEDFNSGVLIGCDLLNKNELFRINIKLNDIDSILGAHFGKDTSEIYFIGRKTTEGDDFIDDIYHMDLITKKINQITYTKNMKLNLIYCR